MEKLTFTETLVGDGGTLQLQVEIPLPLPNLKSLIAPILKGQFILNNQIWIVTSGELHLFTAVQDNLTEGMVYKINLESSGKTAIFYGEKRFDGSGNVLMKILRIWPMTTQVFASVRTGEGELWSGKVVIKPISFLNQLISFRFTPKMIFEVLRFCCWFIFKFIF
jgi:hypothetical protein